MVNESTTINGVPLRANIYRVVVKMAIDSEAHVPIPIGEAIVYIKDVVDTMVPWPKHLVFLSTAKVKIILFNIINFK